LGQDWATRRAAGEAAAEIAGALRETTSAVASALAVVRREPGSWQRLSGIRFATDLTVAAQLRDRSGGRGRDAILASSTAKLSMGP
jgi:hypothetical protein